MKRLTRLDEQNLIEYFRGKKNVVLAIIFGSYGTEFQREDSDIDFAILFDERLDMLQEMKVLDDLSRILNFENVDLVNVNKAPVMIQFRSLGGKIIYERDYYEVCDYMEKVFKLYADFAPKMHAFDKDTLKTAIEISKY